MGGSPSKPQVQAPGFDYTKATVQLPDLQKYETSVKSAAAVASQQISTLWTQANSYMWIAWILFYVLLAMLFYWYVWPRIYSLFSSLLSATPVTTKNLSIQNASIMEKGSSDKRDITPTIVNMINERDELHVKVDGNIGASEGSSLVIAYQFTGEEPKTLSTEYGKTANITRSNKSLVQSDGSKSWWNSSNLLTLPKDAKEMSTVNVDSYGSEGSYGYQFWMYVSDWNYKFGKEKHIMSRDDPTNPAIMNPVLSLDPVDNKLKISVSVFPTSDSSKAEPAPAGHSGATDDVFICEVPGIPIQTWLAVTVTVDSSRNLDVYLNGKLVKSCFLSGVPKPVSGAVTLNKDGGFAGYMCSFYQYPKFLVPADAQAFFSAGVPCNVPDTTTNYKVTFGVKDTKGEVVSKYMF